MAINRIEASIDKSDYGNFDFLNYWVDGYWLDEKLEQLFPDNGYKGLIPTLSYLMSEDDNIVVWKRIFPEDDEMTVCPILMCPDDLDFSCTLIVAEIINNGNFVTWKRLGVDKKFQMESEEVGTVVEWFPDFPLLVFEKHTYISMLDLFRENS